MTGTLNYETTSTDVLSPIKGHFSATHDSKCPYDCLIHLADLLLNTNLNIDLLY